MNVTLCTDICQIESDKGPERVLSSLDRI